MTANKHAHGSMTWLRKGDKPCHWMTAGLVAYKLCDRHFECATCPLEAAMRGVLPRSARQEDAQLQNRPVLNRHFPDDRLYSGKHLWLKKIESAVWRCGVDAFVAALFPNLARVVLPAKGAEVAQDQAVMWMGARDAYLAALFAPLSGKVLQRNAALNQQPELCVRSPYKEGWLFDLQIDADLDMQDQGLLKAEQIEALVQQQSVVLRDRVHQTIIEQNHDLGALAADGGELNADIKDLLNQADYQDLLKTFLN